MIENSSSSRRSSLPSDSGLDRAPRTRIYSKEQDRDSIVRRVSRLSTEAHPSLILEEMILLECQEMDDSYEMDLGVTEAKLDQIIAGLDDQRGVQ